LIEQYDDFLYRRTAFEPTDNQRTILDSDYLYTLVSGGAQAGKSLVASKYALSRVLSMPTLCFRCTFTSTDMDEMDSHITRMRHGGLYWLVAADYDRTRAEFDYLVTDLLKLSLINDKDFTSRVDPGRITIRKDGTRIETKSAKDPRTLAMYSPNGIVACEASQLDMTTFYRLQERVAPRNGWIFLSGTLEEGSLGWYPKLIQQWSTGTPDARSFKLPTTSNTYLFPGGIDDPKIQRIKESTSDSFFMERIMGEPVPPKGLVFPEFSPSTHVKSIPYDPDYPVHIWIDPGYAGAYAVEAVQIVNEQVRMFQGGEIYERGLTTSEIIKLSQDKEWWANPLKSGVIDIAGTQHQAMPAPSEIWLKEARLYLHSRKIRNINDGDERIRSFLKVSPLHGEPRLVVDPSRTGILSEFGSAPNPFDKQARVYRWKTDRDGTIVGKSPDNTNNHGIRAVTYGLVHNFGYVEALNRDRILVSRF
jgi:hypothetical protein